MLYFRVSYKCNKKNSINVALQAAIHMQRIRLYLRIRRITVRWIKLFWSKHTWQIKMHVFHTNLILTTLLIGHVHNRYPRIETFRVPYVTPRSSGAILSTVWIVCDLKSIFLTLFSLFFLMNFPTKLNYDIF